MTMRRCRRTRVSCYTNVVLCGFAISFWSMAFVSPAHPISAIHPLNPKTQRVRPPPKPQPQPRAKAVLDPHHPTPLHLDMHQNVVLLDNGGGLIKAGLGGECDPSAVIPNCGTPSTAAT
ncbi:hypothetical protein GBA52_014427 [Prunus armeniaca]|nr:hypothetical protein GBA52_014427 [Prunus armeniaca]